MIMARTAIFPTNGDMVTPDGYRNVFGFQPWHRCGKYKKIVGLMHLDGNGLWLLQACSHCVLLHIEHTALCVVLCHLVIRPQQQSRAIFVPPFLPPYFTGLSSDRRGSLSRVCRGHALLAI